MTLTIYEKVNQLTTNLIEDVEPGTLQKFRSSKQDRKDGTPKSIVEKLPFYNSLPYDLRQVIAPDLEGIRKNPGVEMNILSDIGLRRGKEQVSRGGLLPAAAAATSGGIAGFAAPSLFGGRQAFGLPLKGMPVFGKSKGGSAKSKLLRGVLDMKRGANMKPTIGSLLNRTALGLATGAGAGKAGLQGIEQGAAVTSAAVPIAAAAAANTPFRNPKAKTIAAIVGYLGGSLGGEAGREYVKSRGSAGLGGDPFGIAFSRQA